MLHQMNMNKILGQWFKKKKYSNGVGQNLYLSINYNVKDGIQPNIGDPIKTSAVEMVQCAKLLFTNCTAPLNSVRIPHCKKFVK